MLLKKWVQSEKGSSLLEVIASIVIITIISMYFMKYFYQAEQTSALSDHRLVATNLARSVAEQWEHVPFAKLKAEVDLKTSDPLLITNKGEPAKALQYPSELEIPGSVTYKINDITFQTIVEISSVSIDSNAALKLNRYADNLLRAKVTVFWELSHPAEYLTANEGLRKRVSATVETFITKEDIRR